MSCREDLADLLNVSDPSWIAFMPNASMASHVAFSFIAWKAGDIILTSTHENPSVIQEIHWLAHQQVEFSTIHPTSPDEILTTIDGQISTNQIKAIVLSHVSHVDGRVFPIEEIGKMARERGVLFIVDGAQAVGQIPVRLDQLDFDLYFFPGHKWCQGPLGTGALIVHEGFMKTNPAFKQAGAGWNGTRAGRFEIGTHNIGLIAGLGKACKILKKEGLKYKGQKEIRETVKRPLQKFDQIRIQQWVGEQAPGILTFQCRDSEEHQMIMNQFHSAEDIVVKQFLNYPEGETPSIRLSWAGEEDKSNVLFAVKVIEKGLNLS